MPTYVLHRGRMIDKRLRPSGASAKSTHPAPTVQSFESYPSPVTGQSISSHRQRERDLHSSGSYDTRDTPPAFKEARHARRQARRTYGEPSRHR
jgi:hypothetical protein